MNNLNKLTKSIIQFKNNSYYLFFSPSIYSTISNTALNNYIRRNLSSITADFSFLNKNVNNNSIIRILHTSTAFHYSAKEKKIRDKIRKFTKKSQMKPILIKPNMTIRELADALERPTSHVYNCLKQLELSHLFRNNRDTTVIPNLDLITKIVKLSGFRYQLPGPIEIDYDKLQAELEAKDDKISKRPRPNQKDLIRRHPVVTIMGHVDHV